MTINTINTGPLKTQFFELAECITTDVVGSDFAVSTAEDLTPEDILEARMPRNPELEITTMYLGSRGVQNIEVAHFNIHADDMEFEMNKYMADAEFENEWWAYVYETLCRFIGRQEVIAVYPSVLPTNVTEESKFAVSSESEYGPSRKVDNRTWTRDTESYFAA